MKNVSGKEFKYQYYYLSRKPEAELPDYSRARNGDGSLQKIPNPKYNEMMKDYLDGQAWGRAWNEHVDSGQVIHIRFISGKYNGSVYELVPASYITPEYTSDQESLSQLDCYSSEISVRLAGKKRSRKIKDLEEVEFLFDYKGETFEVISDISYDQTLLDDNGHNIKVGEYVLGTYRKYRPNTQGQYDVVLSILKYTRSAKVTVFFETETGGVVKGERNSFILYKVEIDPLLITAKHLGAENILSIAKISIQHIEND